MFAAAFAQSVIKYLGRGERRSSALTKSIGDAVEGKIEFRGSHRDSVPWAHPAFWGHYVLHGDYRPITA